MATAPVHPTYAAFFTVGVRVSEAGDGYAARAEEIVANYLYNGAEVVGTLLSDDLEMYNVSVRVTGYADGGEIVNRVQYQRDRLSSGLYSSTAPVFLGQMDIG